MVKLLVGFATGIFVAKGEYLGAVFVLICLLGIEYAEHKLIKIEKAKMLEEWEKE